jgi:3D (Asp-Asp-Asp) domain-containing protein
MKVEGSHEASSALEKKRVEVMADNHNITVDTHAETVGEVLKQLNLSVGEQDIVEPSPTTKLSGQMQIRVTRISEFENEVVEDIPYVTVTYNDPDLLIGNEEVIQEGKPGKEVVRRSLRVENGVTVTKEVISRQVIVPYTPGVVAAGTAVPAPAIATFDLNHSEGGQVEVPPYYYAQSSTPKVVTIEARPVNYKFKLDDVQLTAYTAGFESTGKNPGEPGYGITASGTTVSEGRTIAVDPAVIPLGWWVYIEGVGYRKAEDTGSAIKGKIIDVYIEDLNKANKFGRKYGKTVYVIGPEKPN